MATQVIREVATGLFLSADFSVTSFVDAKRVSDLNDATWLSTVDDDDACVLASVSGEFEIVDLSECEDDDGMRLWRFQDANGEIRFFEGETGELVGNFESIEEAWEAWGK
jgi:hypothetical protein